MLSLVSLQDQLTYKKFTTIHPPVPISSQVQTLPSDGTFGNQPNRSPATQFDLEKIPVLACCGLHDKRTQEVLTSVFKPFMTLAFAAPDGCWTNDPKIPIEMYSACMIQRTIRPNYYAVIARVCQHSPTQLFFHQVRVSFL